MSVQSESNLIITGDDLFRSCCKGNLARVRYLVEKMEYDPNVRDKWDSTPLYYACLCGHTEVVTFLLENGARCEALTFDGERCFYGALTEEIRNLLKGAKVLNASKKQRDEFEEFTERLLKSEEYSDIEITIRGEVFKLHKCILRARSGYYRRKLARSKAKVSEKNDVIMPKHFEELVRFMYTGKFTCSRHEVSSFISLIQLLDIYHLEEYLLKEISAAESYGSSKAVFKILTCVIGKDRSQNHLGEDFKTIFKPGLPHKYQKLIELKLQSPIDVDEVQDDLDDFDSSDEGGDCSDSDDSELKSVDDDQSSENEFDSKERDACGFDICFDIDGNIFRAHKLFVCIRSSYIESLIRSPLTEKLAPEDGSSVETYQLKDVSPDVFTAILNYIYTGRRNTLRDKNVVDVMIAADYFIIPGLKKQCSEVMMTWTKPSNVFRMLRLSRTFNLLKLEEFCFHVIAMFWGKLRHDEELKSMIKEYASEIKCRQETDSIEIIDEVRYHIAMKKSQFHDAAKQHEVDTKIAEELSQVDELLAELGLEA